MELNIRLLDRGQLPGFRQYLLPGTAAAIERGDENVIAIGAVSGRYALGAAAVRLDGTGDVRFTDLFVDAAVRRQGVGSLLVETVVDILAATDCTELTARYALDREEMAAMDALLTGRGFTQPELAAHCFRAMSEDYRDHPIIRRAFDPKYRTPEGVVAFEKLSEEALNELERADIPGELSWSMLKHRVQADLSAALVREDKVLAYMLAEESPVDGFVLRAAVSREGAPATAFITLLLELINRCWYRAGSEFAFYFATVNDHAEQLARSVMNGACTEYEEHRCHLILDKTDGEE